MNIFWLSLNLILCVQYHCDKHVVKMILEYAQLLCTAHQVLDGVKEERRNAKGKLLAPKYVHPDSEKLYRVTHINHPCAVWVRKSEDNYRKLYELFVLLCKEYTHRYGKIHKTEQKLLNYLKDPPKNIPIGKFTVPPICIANSEIKVRKDGKLALVASYRNYYNVEKARFAVWTNRSVPEWFNPVNFKKSDTLENE